MCSCADVGKSCKLGWWGVFPAPWLFWSTGGGLLGVRLVNCSVGLGHYWTVSWRGCLSCSQLTSCLSVSFQSRPTLCVSMNCSLPGSSVHGLLQARILEWVAMPSSRVSSWLGDQTWFSYIARWAFYHRVTREALVWRTRTAENMSWILPHLVIGSFPHLVISFMLSTLLVSRDKYWNYHGVKQCGLNMATLTLCRLSGSCIQAIHNQI